MQQMWRSALITCFGVLWHFVRDLGAAGIWLGCLSAWQISQIADRNIMISWAIWLVAYIFYSVKISVFSKLVGEQLFETYLYLKLKSIFIVEQNMIEIFKQNIFETYLYLKLK